MHGTTVKNVCHIFIKFGIGVVHKKLLNKSKFREKAADRQPSFTQRPKLTSFRTSRIT